MKTFKNQAAQGDCFIRRIDALPDGLVKVPAENGNYVIAHSETGHNHVIEAKPDIEVFRPADSEFRLFMVLNSEKVLEHKRSHDTHESLLIPAGTYEVRRQREYTPEGYRRAAD